ncbi:MAG: redox-sensitive transcriptional activator SoxR [Marinosulfonomonas sp.]|nr:redox-sensitive transcriptional activator SoxR [Marinosulfonomonas sp.]
MAHRRGLTIGQLAERTGLAVSAIRFYEEKGLVKPDRNDGGQRRYERADIRRLSFVMISQKLGFSLAEVQKLFRGLPDGRTPTKSDWTRISKSFRLTLDARIHQMEQLRDKLDGCIGCGCLSLTACALYNPDDQVGNRGTGPRYLMGDAVDDP